ncbi:hypothetical protein A3C87_03435 [Candidatus Kaiserbacteria bacterium RIFCSPHIGHO2_02_FULL_49_34]|uniref:Uncharacterized protein n=1 Tax=Candidatus Kaiserbacteria bacterium RIFCSPHIGHO2_02_FULL_49_34 TaxID=1798491 RepID=A0A1F6DIE5_9BACT|nr:MAG: hypothetical protein A3C87_03435 [Candidatus Kaiserbacteria bacterium RIFCSPHIGHO2_02_FULL_49_34]
MDTTPILATINTAATAIGALYCLVLATIIALRGMKGLFERIVFAICLVFALRSVLIWLGTTFSWVGYYHIPASLSIIGATLLAILPFILFSRKLQLFPSILILIGIATTLLMVTPDMIYGQTYFAATGFPVLTFGPFINVYRIVLSTLLIVPLIVYLIHNRHRHTHDMRTVANTLFVGQSIYSAFVIASTVVLPIFSITSLTYYNTLVGIAIIASCFTVVITHPHAYRS